MNRCNSCGMVGMDSDQFCGNCGSRLAPTAPPYPYYVPVRAPQTDRTAVIIVVVIVVILVLTTAGAAILYVMVSGLIPPHTMLPRTLGVTVTRSSDGLNWILTFTSVPTGLMQNATMFSMFAYNGSWVFTPTSLYLLEGGGQAGVRYVPNVTGPANTACEPGDRILVAYGSGTDQYPAGTVAHIINAESILYSGTLQ